MSQTIDITPSPTEFAKSQAVVLLSWADKCSLSGVDFSQPHNQERINNAFIGYFGAIKALSEVGIGVSPALYRKIANATLTKHFNLV